MHKRPIATSILLVLFSFSAAQGQTSLWLPTIERTSTQVTYKFTTKVPDFFADWMQNYPRPGSAETVQKTINGQNYTLLKRGNISWDTGGSSPAKTGQISFDKGPGMQGDGWRDHPDLKNSAELIRALDAAAVPAVGAWRRAELLALKWDGSGTPNVTLVEEIPPLEQARARLRELAKNTVAGKYYPQVKVPADLNAYRETMLEIANLGRRDPDYRKKLTDKKYAKDLGAEYAQTDQGREKIYHHSKTPPYFKDLALDYRLNDAAQLQAEWAAQRNYMGHDGPPNYNGTNMKDLGDRQKFFAPSYGSIVEAGGWEDAPEGWMKSDTHYRPWFNVYHDVKYVGFGAAVGGDGKLRAFGVAVGTKPHTDGEQSDSYTFQLPLKPGEQMEREKKYSSNDGRQYLIWNKDGNLQIFYFRDPQPKGEKDEWVWGLANSPHKISPQEIKSVRMSASGHLEVLGENDKVRWTAPNTKLSLGWTDVSQDPVVLGEGGAQPARNETPPPAATATPPPATTAKPAPVTTAKPSPAAADSFKMPLPPGTTLQRAKRYVSSDGKHYLILQDDNNLVIRRVSDDGFVWGLNEQPNVDYKKANAARVTDQRRFTVVDSANREIWGLDMNDAFGLIGTHLDITSDGHLTARDP